MPSPSRKVKRSEGITNARHATGRRYYSDS